MKLKLADLLLIPVFVAVVVLNVCALGIPVDTAVALAFLWVPLGAFSAMGWVLLRELDL